MALQRYSRYRNSGIDVEMTEATTSSLFALLAFVRPMLVAFTLLCALSGNAQDELMIYGVVKDMATGAVLQNACVRIHTEGVPGDSVFTDPLGGYQIRLPFNAVHMIEFGRDAFHTKWVRMSTVHDMDALDRDQEWGMRVDISLADRGLDLPKDLLDMPAGIAAWIPERHAFEWDGPYSERYKIRFRKEAKAAEKRK